VKYHVLLPSIDDVGGAVDYYQWAGGPALGERIRVVTGASIAM
jgi:hypothetical protein